MNHFSYPLTFVQINIFEEPQNIFSTKIPDPKLSSQPPRIFNYRVPPWGWKIIWFLHYNFLQGIMGSPVVGSTDSCREHLRLSGVPTVVERTYSCLDYLQLLRASSVIESTFSYPKYPQLLRAPPLVQSTSSCREHLQLSKVSPVVQSTSSCPRYLQLSRVPPAVESTSTCPKHLQLSRVIFVRQGAS